MDPDNPTNQDDKGAADDIASTDEAFADAVSAGLRGEELPETDDQAGAADEKDDADGGDGDGKPADGAAAADDKAKAADQDAPQPGDDVDDPLDESVDERTRVRFDKMRETYKEASAERDEALGQLDELRSVINETGSTAEDFAQTIDLLADRNSGDPDRMNRAYDQLKSELLRMGEVLGRPLTVEDTGDGPDPLEAFPDLREMVDNLDITEAAAAELAQARRAQQLREAAANRSAEAETTAAQTQQSIATGAAGVDALMDGYRTNDPDFKTKADLIAEDLKQIAANVPPNQWVARIQAEWQRLTRVMEATGARPGGTRTNQPLSGGSARSGSGAPSSFAGAISQGLRGDGG